MYYMLCVSLHRVRNGVIPSKLADAIEASKVNTY